MFEVKARARFGLSCARLLHFTITYMATKKAVSAKQVIGIAKNTSEYN